MLIKNYTSRNPQSPALDLNIIEDVTEVIVHANLHPFGFVGNLQEAGVTTVYTQNGEDGPSAVGPNKFTRHIDFTRYGVRCRLLVAHHAYVCNNEGKTIEKVAA